MRTSTPSDMQTFLGKFPNWPNDSLKERRNIESGSRWAIRDIGTFQILRIAKEFPLWLGDRYDEALERVRASTEIQRAIQLLNTNWRNLSRAALIEASGSFGAFFSLLAEVTEQPPTPMPNRYLRSDIPQGHLPQSSQESSSSSSSGLPSSPLGPPPKRIRVPSASDGGDSYHPSNNSAEESEQSRYDDQVKAEPVANGCFYHFLECVTENSRRIEDAGFRLEWALTQDSFHVQTPRSHFSSKNDGGLVHRGNKSDQWKRKSDISYCSIEAKARYHIITKSEENQAQEAAHMIGMYAQRISRLKPPPHLRPANIHPWNVIPLTTVSQNKAYLLLGTFTPEYATYLETGEQSQELAFLRIEEFGPFDLTVADDFELMSTFIVALVLKLEALGPIPDP